MFTGFALKRNFAEGLIPLILGLLTAALLCWDYVFIPWYEKKYEGKEDQISSGRLMKILNWTVRIIGIGIVLGVFGWLIYDIFFQSGAVKASVLMKLIKNKTWRIKMVLKKSRALNLADIDRNNEILRLFAPIVDFL